MESPEIKTYEFKGSKGPGIVWLIFIGAAISGALYLVLKLFTTLEPFSGRTVEGALVFCLFVVAPIVALILKRTRDRVFGPTL